MRFISVFLVSILILAVISFSKVSLMGLRTDLARQRRNLSLCLNCCLDIDFLENGETMAPSQIHEPSSPHAVTPDSQLGLPLQSSPTDSPTISETLNWTDNEGFISVSPSQSPTEVPAMPSESEGPSCQPTGWFWFRRRGCNSGRPRLYSRQEAFP